MTYSDYSTNSRDYSTNSRTTIGDGFASFFENVFSTYNSWLQQAQETQRQVTEAFLNSLESGLQRQRETAGQTQDLTERFARVQREWAQELNRQFRDYQFQAAEQYRNSFIQAVDTWSDVTRQQLRDTAERVRNLSERLERLSSQTEEAGQFAHEDTQRAIDATEASTERTYEGAQATVEGLEQPLRRGATAGRKAVASEHANSQSGNSEGSPEIEVVKA